MIAYINFADRVSEWFGKAFAWLIMAMAFGVGYEVFVRYVLNSPTTWALDFSYMTISCPMGTSGLSSLVGRGATDGCTQARIMM